jgi:exosortase
MQLLRWNLRCRDSSAMPDNREASASSRWLLFGSWILLCSLLFLKPLISLVRLSLTQDDMSHLIVIPFVVACLLFVERHPILRSTRSDIALGSLFVVLALGIVATTKMHEGSLPSDLQLSVNILALLVLCIAGFTLFFGRTATRAACFPLLYLFLMVPPPDFLLYRVIYLLEAGSADITGALFDLLRVPALREGFIFHLPQVSIAVEKECSGIRSSMALLILALPVVHFGFKRLWKKVAFLGCAMLVMIVKNGIRIVTLTLLAMYVDPSFLFGKLHHRGGIVFFLLGLLLLVPIYLALQVGESPSRLVDSTADNNLQSRDGSQPAQIGQV